MNLRQMKTAISKFRNADVTVIKDAEMRAKAQKLQAKQGGFTLLELLVVVAILAIIAGAVISSLDGQEELAAQKTTVHTMAALEEGFSVYKATAKRTLPSNLDSLLCTAQVDASGAAAAVIAGTDPREHAGTAIVTSGAILGGSSNVARVGGGLTLDLGGSLTPILVPANIAANVVDAGLTSLRYVDELACNDVEDDLFSDDPALVDVTKPNLIFNTALLDDGEWEYGAGEEISFAGYSAAYDDGDGTAAAIPMAILEEGTEVSGSVGTNDVIAVFGIGSSSDIVGDIVARAPADGNGGPDKYSNFSVAVKIAECPALGVEIGDTGCTAADWTPADIEVIAILDAGGDAYDDEVAEARGNQEE
ncbi:MAG: type II secretion system protein [Methylophaga sp.]|jgi:prepilin-type N-terminal cleavage/methylation domain-containing protein|uniref:type II secretion system protein n=1 Tax=Methylophaga sp. TaxID=2024840 RepID=UPI000C11D650|nr:type II secretion system protein [Methylophaga sp.]MBL1457523.1 type II secretion system protein [Methylophaga sp.]